MLKEMKVIQEYILLEQIKIFFNKKSPKYFIRIPKKIPSTKPKSKVNNIVIKTYDNSILSSFHNLNINSRSKRKYTEYIMIADITDWGK